MTVVIARNKRVIYIA